jgi:group I intron endonuclease
MIGVYSITNLADGKRYIGQSAGVEKRLGEHKSLLKHGRHKNSHLQNAFSKYGYDSFSFDILCECSESELDSLECHWISFYGTTDPHNVQLSTRSAISRIDCSTRR